MFVMAALTALGLYQLAGDHVDGSGMIIFIGVMVVVYFAVPFMLRRRKAKKAKRKAAEPPEPPQKKRVPF